MRGNNVKIGAGVVFYKDYFGMRRLLHSLRNVDVVFCIDGRFKDFPNEEPLSSESERMMIKSFPNTVLIDAPNLTEIQKRDIYFKHAQQYLCDWLLVIDSDEILQYFDYKKFKNIQWKEDVLFTQIHKKEFNSPLVWQIRLHKIKHKAVYRHGPRHFDLHVDNQYHTLGLRMQKPLKVTDECIIYSDDSMRLKFEPEHAKQCEEYSKWLSQFEKPLKRTCPLCGSQAPKLIS